MKRPLRIPALVSIFLLTLTALGTVRIAQAAPAQLDEEAKVALSALYESSPAAKALGAKAKAVLVFPDIHKAGLIVGAQSGDGVMFKDGSVASHYTLTGLQAGLEAGAETYGYALFFMSDAALDGLRASRGFDIGADPNFVFVDVGAAKEISTATVQVDIYGYVFNQKGLMGGVSLQGVKISKLDR